MSEPTACRGLAHRLGVGSWRSDSAESNDRSDGVGPTGVDTLDELVERSDVVVSVCPPVAAIAVADQVAAIGFDGVYVDANAIALDTAGSAAQRFARFVDGGISLFS